jgi:hypothetical protein
MNSGNDSRRSGTPEAMAFTELASTNLSETRKFLEDTFGWKFDSVRMPTRPVPYIPEPRRDDRRHKISSKI